MRGVRWGGRGWIIGLLLLATGGLAGCRTPAPVAEGPLQTVWWRAHPDRAAKRLLVFLPGRGDHPKDFERRGLRRSLQRQWPDTDIVAVDATLGYYMNRSIVNRLEADVMAPALRDGYEEVWLLGISLGGLGALLWETTHPGTVDGLLLIAPYLGEDRELLAEIANEGGLDTWQPEPGVSEENFHRAIWQRLSRGEMPRNVWLALGERDRFRPGMEVLAQDLSPERVRRLPGGHRWSVWRRAFDDLLLLADKEAGPARAGHAAAE